MWGSSFMHGEALKLVRLFIFKLLAIRNKGFLEVWVRHLSSIYILYINITMFLILQKLLCVTLLFVYDAYGELISRNFI